MNMTQQAQKVDWTQVSLGTYYNTLVHTLMDATAQHGGFEHRIGTLAQDLLLLVTAQGIPSLNETLSEELRKTDAAFMYTLVDQARDQEVPHAVKALTQLKEYLLEQSRLYAKAHVVQPEAAFTEQVSLSDLQTAAQHVVDTCLRLEAQYGAAGYAHNAALAGLSNVLAKLRGEPHVTVTPAVAAT